MARKIYKDRHDQFPKKSKGKYKQITELIGFTNMSDKANMIWKNSLIKGSSRSRFLRVFNKLEQVRNLCAHARFSYELDAKYPPKELGELIELAKDLKKKLVEAIENNRQKLGEALLNDLTKKDE